jgi:hypothetical protein
MKYRFIISFATVLLLFFFSACQKWADKPASDLGLKNKYCNIPSAINYNQGFPGIEDNSVCIFPSEPFVGSYTYQDSVYDNNLVFLNSTTYHFNIVAINRTQMRIENFCSSSSLLFTADRYYRASSDTVIGNGTQLMCRTLDTLGGTLVYKPADSSMYIEWKVISDTATNIHKGIAFKK